MSKMYTNPTIPGFYPDPSICRVGDDYYLVTSTFEFFPGVPIFHSKDLINWEQIGHVLDRPSQLNLDGVANSAGIYAPTIRYHEGTFYMVTTVAAAYGTHQNFYVSATDPEGPWSEPFMLKDAPGIDPSFIFTGGRMIYCGNGKPEYLGGKSKWEHHRNIWAREIVPDTGEELGEKQVIIDTADWDDQYGQEKCNAWEAPHIYKKDGWFYLMVASGGTGWGHSQYIFRSKDPFGPYTEAHPVNPMMTHRHLPQETHPIHCTGHGDFVQTQNGEWYMVFLATRPYGGMRNYLGRETMMVPIDWSGDWPVIKGGGIEVKEQYPVPDLPWTPVEKEPVRDDFDHEAFSYPWYLNRTPREQWWDLEEKPGTLRIQARPHRLTENENQSIISRRITDLEFEAATVCEFDPQAANEEAGMVMYKSTTSHFRLVIGKSGTAFGLEARPDESGSKKTAAGGRVIRLIKRLRYDDRDSLLAEVPAPDGPVYFKMGTRNRRYLFAWSADGKDWQELDNTFDVSWLSQVVAGGFVGINVGMFAGSNGETSESWAEFDWFDYKGLD